MRYFENFPVVWHKLVGTNDQVLIQNITRRVVVVDGLGDIEGLLLDYNIFDGETPRAFAERVYGSFELFWVVCLINGIFDIAGQWPKPEKRVLAGLMAQYGQSGMYAVKHYVDVYGTVTDPLAQKLAHNDIDATDEQAISRYNLYPVTYYDYELDQNNRKRAVKVLDPDYVALFAAQLEKELA